MAKENAKQQGEPKVVREMMEEAQRKHPTDVLGSWTGVPWDEEEVPVQDVDDL